MAKIRYYRCEDCGGTFQHFLQFTDSPGPDECPLCAGMGAAPQETFVPQAPGIKKSLMIKSVDQTYRAMEAASIARAAEAASMAGVPDAEMAHLKITNMKDPSSMREGDIAAITPPPKNTPMPSTNLPGSFNGLSAPGGQAISGQQFAQAAAQGAGAGTGARTHGSVVVPHHRQMAHLMQRHGQMNR